MGDLSQFQAEESLTVKSIYDYWKKKGDSEPVRGYLGASIIGHECDRYLWFMFRQCVTKAFEGRMYRLFDRGRLEEARFAEELAGIGCEVHLLGDDGAQYEVTAVGGHFKAHMDGCALGVPEAPKTWHVLEFKTHNDKSFTKLVSDGVKKSKPMHYAQCMIEMGLTKMERALYLAVNKDTDELYSERIRYSASEFKAIETRAERIIKSNQPCERLTDRSDDYRCKFCDAYDLCWAMGKAALPIPAKNCRTCCHATPLMTGEDGQWNCTLNPGTFISSQCQAVGCEKHLVIPGLLTFCKPCDAGEEWIEFQNDEGGEKWKHGQQPGMWTTEELMITPAKLVGERGVELVKSIFGGSVSASDEKPLSLVEQYPHGDTRLLWNGKNQPLLFEPELRKALGLSKAADIPEPTRTEEADTTSAYEFGGKFLLVIYKADNHAAIWRGVE